MNNIKIFMIAYLLLAITVAVHSPTPKTEIKTERKVLPLVKVEKNDVPLEPLFMDICDEVTRMAGEKTETTPDTIPETAKEEPTISPVTIEEKYREEIIYISKTVWGEARGCSTTEQAAVIWCILNRVDCQISYIPNNIIDVITQEDQFHGYREEFPVTDDIRELAIDVLTRWEMEKAGEDNVGRILPIDYLWFYGDGQHNHFRDSFDGRERWDWSLESPYA